MKNKCEWKDKKFYPCENFNGIIYWQDLEGERRYICSACQVNIHKPESEKPLIVKSGETKVKRENGQDYLLLNPYGDEVYWLWKPFNEIILDDKIALLRPMIRHSYREYPVKFIARIECDDGFSIIVYNHIDLKADRLVSTNCRLATVRELQEAG